jgi:hypothetical protein
MQQRLLSSILYITVLSLLRRAIKPIGEFQFTLCHGKIKGLKTLESLILNRFKPSFSSL